jgi:hypothetical protein
VGHDDDGVASVIEQPLDRPGQTSPDVGRLDRLVEEDRQVAEPVDEEAVDHLANRELANDRDRDPAQKVVAGEREHAGAPYQPADRPRPEGQRLDAIQLLGEPPIQRRQALADDVGGLGQLDEPWRAVAVSGSDPRDDGGHPSSQVVDRLAEIRRTQVGSPPGFGDDPGRSRHTGVLRDADLQIGRRGGIERELGSPDGVVDALVSVSVVRGFGGFGFFGSFGGLGGLGRLRRPPVGEQLDDRAGPIEERLARSLRADAVDEDDPSPPRDADRQRAAGFGVFRRGGAFRGSRVGEDGRLVVPAPLHAADSSIGLHSLRLPSRHVSRCDGVP